MTPEAQARQHIDRMLEDAGWAVQDLARYDPGVPHRGIAVREAPFDQGEADYLLVVDRQAVGIIEAKPEGTTLGGVAEQSQKYVVGDLKQIPAAQEPLPFAYESTGIETYFRDERDPHPRSRRVFHFHRPETLAEWIGQADALRARLRRMPVVDMGTLRACQYDAIEGLERSFAEDRPRALVQMATGSGKTFMAVTECYRLLRYAKANRILFLVDRTNLGRQTENEFQQYDIADTGNTFTQEYNVQLLRSPMIDDVSDICITTIQRVYSILRGDDLDEEDEELSLFETTPTGHVQDVVYNPKVPPETFDFIIVDECHRSIYNVWRQVLEYFDAYLVGLTATPSKQTFGFFRQNLVTEYPYERSVADGVNVGYDVYRIKTRITEQGSKVEAGQLVVRREKKTRQRRIEELDEDLEYAGTDLDRSVTSIDQIRTVIRTFRDSICTEIFPNRSHVPKTLIFAKDDNHAEEILHIVREEFGRGNEFAKKVTYKVQDPEAVIKQFRNSVMPRIVVSVDMIATGTDIKPLEVLLFMRDVKSSVYFDQMKGRGTRTIDPTDLKAVTGDAERKTHFVLVDAVGVTETEKTDSKPLEQKPSVSFDKLLRSVAFGTTRDEASLQSLADRFARMDRALDESERGEIETELARSDEERGHGIATLPALIHRLLDAADLDVQIERAKETFATDDPDDVQIEAAARELAAEACTAVEDADVRETISDVRRRSYVTIDEISADEVIEIDQMSAAGEWAEQTVTSFHDFIDEHRDEITALQIFYQQPYGKRHLTLEQIRELADAIRQPPLSLTPEDLWHAYARLEQGKVRGAGEQRLLTDMISLVRHAMGEDEELYPFREDVEARFYEWLERQDRENRFSAEQLEWLEMVKDHLAANLTVERDDLELSPFDERGGIYRAAALFGLDELDALLEELNDVVTA